MNEITSDIIKQQIATLEAELLQAKNSGQPVAVKQQLIQRINILKSQLEEPLSGIETAFPNDDESAQTGDE
jgi:hypothetical protein